MCIRDSTIHIHFAYRKYLGIAHQLWPAAVFLCDYIGDHPDYFLSLLQQPPDIPFINNHSKLSITKNQDRPIINTNPIDTTTTTNSHESTITKNYDLSTMSTHESSPPLHVLELGSGLGLCGLFVASYLKHTYPTMKAKVVLTDLSNAIEGWLMLIFLCLLY